MTKRVTIQPKRRPKSQDTYIGTYTHTHISIYTKFHAICTTRWARYHSPINRLLISNYSKECMFHQISLVNSTIIVVFV